MRPHHPLRSLICLALIITLLGGACPAYAISEKKLAAVNEKVDKFLKNFTTTGAAVLVSKKGQIVYEHYYGYRNKKEKQRVNKNTYFRLASVTKLVSAVRVMQLAEIGELDIDGDISFYLGYEARNPYFRDLPITLRMLMSHTSSVYEENALPKRLSLEELLHTDKRWSGYYWDEKPGAVYRYSNFGAGIMGAVTEAVTGVEFGADLRENVLIPLKIDASFYPSQLKSSKDIACIYNEKGSSVTLSWEGALKLPVVGKADPQYNFRTTVGGLWMRPRDLLKIGQMLSNLGQLDGVRLMDEDTARIMMLRSQGQGDVTAKTPYGLCVENVTSLVEGKTFYGHQGLVEGALCNVYFEPESQYVFVFLSNGCNPTLANRIAGVTRSIFGTLWQAFGGK